MKNLVRLMADQEQFKTKYSLISVKDGLVKSINEFFKNILIKTELAGILAMQELPMGRGFIPSLMTDQTALDHVNVLAPIMPVNAAKAISDYTRLKPGKKKIAVVLRPCELRALIELVKLNQANLENLIIIGVDCPGTFSIQDYTESSDKDKMDTDALIKSITKLKDIPDLRTACQSCEHFTPANADIIIGLYGLELNKHFLVSATTQAGLAVLEPLNFKFDAAEAGNADKKRIKAIATLKEKRLKITSELEEATHNRIHGLDNFMNELSACINCHNCMKVCPICYCKECFFESPTFDLESDKYLQMANRKGSLRMPANMFLFHVIRFNHMVLSCVACGMCEQGCPANIPLLSIYKTVGRRAQKVFDYEPGRSLAEEIPILTFKEDELEPK
jgi:formate dehydrogenase subunit beta